MIFVCLSMIDHFSMMNFLHDYSDRHSEEIDEADAREHLKGRTI